jgi:hypothetical protein
MPASAILTVLLGWAEAAHARRIAAACLQCTLLMLVMQRPSESKAHPSIHRQGI